MASEPIHVSDDSELPRILDEATERPVRFERKGVVYRLSVVERPDDEWTDADRDAVLAALEKTSGAWADDGEELWTNYDPEAVRHAVREATGAIPGDADELVERLYEARRIGSRPITRP